MDNSYKIWFERAKAVAKMVVEAQDDMRQLRADCVEALIDPGMAKSRAKEIAADIGEIFSLAMIAAKAEERKAAAKLARRQRVAELVGMQLDLFAAVVEGEPGAVREVTVTADALDRIREVAREVA